MEAVIDKGAMTGMRGNYYQWLFTDAELISEIGEHLAGEIGPQVRELVARRDELQASQAKIKENIAAYGRDLTIAENQTAALRDEGNSLILAGQSPRALDSKLEASKTNEATITGWIQQYREQLAVVEKELAAAEDGLYAAIMVRVETYVGHYAGKMNEFLRRASAVDTCWQKGVTEAFRKIKGPTRDIQNYNLRLRVDKDSKFGRK